MTSGPGWTGAQGFLNMERRGAEFSQSLPGHRALRPSVSLTQVSAVRSSIPESLL
jgi:hypothetical protein